MTADNINVTASSTDQPGDVLYARLAALEQTVAQTVQYIGMLTTLALKYHHQEVVAMQPATPITSPDSVLNALHIPN